MYAADLTTGPSTKHLQSSFISSDLGVIEVKVLRASKCTKNEKPSDFAAPITQNTLTIQESKLKGLTTSHGTW